MKRFIRENLVTILLVAFLGLLFVFWGRMIVKELYNNTYHENLYSLNARLACLAHYGWEGDPASEIVKTVTVPNPLDAVYQKYNQIQKICGFDLNAYRGMRVECYTYEILNFPYKTNEPVYANLIIHKGKLIGGDCMSTTLDGFMLPLDRKYMP